MPQKIVSKRKLDPQVRINFMLSEKIDKTLSTEARKLNITTNAFYHNILVQYALNLGVKKEKP